MREPEGTSKPVSIPGTIKWQPGRVVDGIRGGAVYLYAINRYGTECCLGKLGSPEDAKGTPYEREVAEVFAAEELRAQGAFLDSCRANDEQAQLDADAHGLPNLGPEAHSGSPSGRTHDLKCWPEPFAAIASGRKAFEWRRDDRDFQLGDVLRLREWRPDSESYTGAEALCGVTYVLRGKFGVPDGFVVLGIGSPETTVRGA